MTLMKKIFAGGGMDSDTEDRFVAPEDYRRLLNARVGELRMMISDRSQKQKAIYLVELLPIRLNPVRLQSERLMTRRTAESYISIGALRVIIEYTSTTRSMTPLP